MLYLLFKSINPATRISLSDLKVDIDILTLSKLRNNVRDVPDNIPSDYTIIINKGGLNENYVCHIFIDLLEVPNSTFNRFIGISNYEWDTGIDIESR